VKVVLRPTTKYQCLRERRSRAAISSAEKKVFPSSPNISAFIGVYLWSAKIEDIIL
jgi:hypothetical protein